MAFDFLQGISPLLAVTSTPFTRPCLSVKDLFFNYVYTSALRQVEFLALLLDDNTTSRSRELKIKSWINYKIADQTAVIQGIF